MTIAEAAHHVLKNSGMTLSVQDIYNKIVEQNLYTFKAKNPKGVMSQAIRERSDANAKASEILFKSHGNGNYSVID